MAAHFSSMGSVQVGTDQTVTKQTSALLVNILSELKIGTTMFKKRSAHHGSLFSIQSSD